MNVIPERIMRKISPEPNSGCWLWTAFVNHKGYAHIKMNGKMQRAHRVIYELMRGPIPAGLQLDHLCRVRCCVNPQHLEPVTNRENSLRSPLIGGKTHCHRGHLYDEANTRIHNGWRECRTCIRLYYGRRQPPL